MTLFVDTSAFFALANLADKHHAEAVAAYQTSIGADDLQTSDHVIIETWYLLRSRLGRRAAMAFWDGFDGGVITVVGVTAGDFRRGREIAQEWPDQAFSIVDCTSFALIERELLGKRSKRDYPKDAIMAFIGLGSAEPGDTSERHDEALDEAFRG